MHHFPSFYNSVAFIYKKSILKMMHSSFHSYYRAKLQILWIASKMIFSFCDDSIEMHFNFLELYWNNLAVTGADHI